MDVPTAVAELERAALALSGMAGEIVGTGSSAARQAILDTVSSARGTLSVSGLGATLEVETAVSASQDSAQAAVRAVPANAWALVDKGAQPHGERVRRGRGMPTTYGVFARVRHPGTAGLNIAPVARRAADAAVDDMARTALQALPRH